MSGSSVTVLELADVAVHFAARQSFLSKLQSPVRAVRGVSFDVAAGETLGLVGESGCGKSTLANAIVGLVRPTRGSIRVNGTEISGASRAVLHDVRRNVQMIFQDPALSLNPRMTIGGAIGEPLAVRGIAQGRELATRVAESLVAVGLKPGDAGRYPHQFSGGQRQRIVIARALSLEPSLVVCDEPVSALDVSVRAQILNLLMGLQRHRGMAYLFVSHDLSVIRHICDRVAVMYLGLIVEQATRETLFAAPKHPYTRALLSAVPEVDAARRSTARVTLKGELPSPSNIPSGCSFRTRCPIATDLCRVETPPLASRSDGSLVACHHA